MKLSEEQLNKVATWFAGGASVAEIQKKVAREFGVSLTYLDARLLVAELPQPAEPEESVESEALSVESEADSSHGEARSGVADGMNDVPPDAPSAEGVTGDVTVDVDAIMIPGTMASGNVTFSDGTSGKWYLDRTGRLGLGDIPEGYRPSQTDAAMFQQKLVEALRAKGLA